MGEDLLKRILRILAKELQTRGKLQPEEAFIDASFTGAKKWGLGVGPTKRGKGTKITALADDHSLSLAVSIESASPHESQQVEGVLAHSFLDTLPARLICDRAYDSDRLDRVSVERYGIVMIAPHRGVPDNNARRPSFAPLPQTLASRATIRLAPSLSLAGDPLGVPCRELLRPGPPRVHANLDQVSMNDYSYRNATMGSSFIARRAGT